jgi:hypothetical protein
MTDAPEIAPISDEKLAELEKWSRAVDGDDGGETMMARWRMAKWALGTGPLALIARVRSERQAGIALGVKAAAVLCDREKDARLDRAEHPWPGDSLLQPFPQSMVQTSKALTAQGLANAIRALDPAAIAAAAEEKQT